MNFTGFAGTGRLAHRRCGKLIVATNDEELGKLAAIKGRALANGVDDLEEMDGPSARSLEPALHCTGALISPSTGIIDSHSYMLALLADAEAHGAVLAYNSPVRFGRIYPGGIELHAGEGEAHLACAPIFASIPPGLMQRGLQARSKDFPPLLCLPHTSQRATISHCLAARRFQD